MVAGWEVVAPAWRVVVVLEMVALWVAQVVAYRPPVAPRLFKKRRWHIHYQTAPFRPVSAPRPTWNRLAYFHPLNPYGFNASNNDDDDEDEDDNDDDDGSENKRVGNLSGTR